MSRGTLAPGAFVGQFRIESLLGRGGMGEVYRARDTSLHRDVAIKVLPALFASDPERLARLKREARALASLNDPHIGAIHGLEESGSTMALVLELVEGPTLAERLAERPLSIDETLRVSRQIAAALEAAHEKGIVHRDLKPSNVKITPRGIVKVLDFGLAKAINADPPPSDAAATRTMNLDPTVAGLIVGTPAYMSPEQARGLVVDARTDIWAFGCVLYEMLTGRVPFVGDTTTDTLAAILERDPDWSRLPSATSPTVKRLLRRCLEKDPARRLHHIADARIEIDDALDHADDTSGAALPHAAMRRGARLARLAWMTAGGCLAALAAVAVVASGVWPRAAKQPAYRASLVLGDARLRLWPANNPSGRFALSPNGRWLAFVAAGSSAETTLPGGTQLWVRALDTGVDRLLPGTDGARFPFWSPDSFAIAFRANDKLKRIDLSGGSVLTLADFTTNSTGTWNHGDVIVFAPIAGGPLYRVSADGGTPDPVTKLNVDAGDVQHWFPSFLPDDRHFLYLATGSKSRGVSDPRAVYVGSLDASEPPKLLTEPGSNAKYAQGHLIFLRERTLVAQPFDLDRLTLHGNARPLAEQIQVASAADTGTAGAFSVSDTGLLAFQSGSEETRSQLVWMDRRTGKQIGTLGDLADYSEVTLSPNDERAAVAVLDPARGTRNVWTYDVERGVRIPLTTDPGDEISPVFSPHGSAVAFTSTRGGGFDLYEKPSSGASKDRVLFGEALGEFPQSWSPDAMFLLYVSGAGTLRRSDLHVLKVTDRMPMPFAETPFTETQGQFSPDGRSIVYTSNESGRPEVYVAPFGRSGERTHISTEGGSWARWRRPYEIVYVAPDGTLMAAQVSTTAAFRVEGVQSLFRPRWRPMVRLDAYLYDISLDGTRFLVNAYVEETASTPVTLVVNWMAESAGAR